MGVEGLVRKVGSCSCALGRELPGELGAALDWVEGIIAVFELDL